jgi:hypothetical protein
MKKLVLVVLALGISLTVFGQNEKLFFKSLSKQRTVHPTVREASMGISNNFTIRDSLLYFTQSFEESGFKRQVCRSYKTHNHSCCSEKISW